ncbi:hypothetical protein [Pedobacter sp. NJ-S-72]
MNHLYKYTVTAIFSITALAANAQDLANKIPADAKAVVTLKGANLIRLMSVKEFNDTFVGKKITEQLAKSAKGDTKTIEDFGFNPASTFYYYNQSNDSISYNCVLAPVKNADQIDQVFKQADKKFTVNDKLRSFYNHDLTEVVLWNNEMLLFVKSDGKESYFARPEVSKRLGLPAPKNNYGLTDSTAATPAYDQTGDYSVATDSAAVTVTVTEQPYIEEPRQVKRKKHTIRKRQKSYSKTVRQKYRTGKKHPKRKTVKKTIIIDEEPPKEEKNYATEDSTAYATAGTGGYMEEIDTVVVNANKRAKQIKNTAVVSWTKKMISGTFSKTDRNSILSNKDFVKSIDEKAEITAWIPNVEQSMLDFIPASIFKGINAF